VQLVKQLQAVIDVNELNSDEEDVKDSVELNSDEEESLRVFFKGTKSLDALTWMR